MGSSTRRMKMTKRRARIVPLIKPMPAARPMPAQTQRPAAVVRPFTSFRPVTMMVPTPRNPMPLMTWAPIRARSVLEEGKVRKMNSFTIMDKAAPIQTRAWVLIPAPLFLYSLSMPIITPASVARNRRAAMPPMVQDWQNSINASMIALLSYIPMIP